ncbi:MAG: glycosyltransferase [Gemmatimonadaceae bacterium]
MKMKRTGLLLVGVIVAGMVSPPATSSAQASMSPASTAPTLRTAMRKLWSDHVIWTRTYIIAAVSGDPSAPTQLQRLMKNQEDIGNAIVPFYGAAAGTKLTELLKQHISQAGEVVAAAKAGDAAKLADADKRWHANAEDLAEFLSKANPNWPKATLQDMLNQHLALTTREATDRIKQNWTDDVAAFDAVYNEIMSMADALTDGIAKQFPSKVS